MLDVRLATENGHARDEGPAVIQAGDGVGRARQDRSVGHIPKRYRESGPFATFLSNAVEYFLGGSLLLVDP